MKKRKLIRLSTFSKSSFQKTTTKTKAKSKDEEKKTELKGFVLKSNLVFLFLTNIKLSQHETN